MFCMTIVFQDSTSTSDVPSSALQTGYLPSVEDLLPHKASLTWTESPYYLHVVLRQKSAASKQQCAASGVWQSPKKREVWFCIPRERADEFCSFILRCSAESDKPTFHEPTDDSAFVVVSGGEEIGDEPIGLYNNLSLNREWEIVTVEEVKRRLSLFDVADSFGLPLPEGSDESKLLDESLIRKIMEILPARAQGYPWILLYSSDRDGFALSTLYRSAGAFKEKTSPCLLVIKDSKGRLFGAIVNCLLRMSDHFYGSGESLLFTNFPEFDVFRWTGANDFIVKGSIESIAIGAGKGLYGLWLDSDLYHGRTEHCDTFDNRLLTDMDFVTAGVELWGFSLGL
ncbi:unnamed protein product [Soboliphyme baturini]|uniref:Oxidation resistance protein 1 n=1 Tax=Soboliphyme baturini TaxID=241478 RepID=A0A183IL85_9BILA|nr:unnamed protein product [Soboliphyme baturini]